MILNWKLGRDENQVSKMRIHVNLTKYCCFFHIFFKLAHENKTKKFKINVVDFHEFGDLRNKRYLKCCLTWNL